MRVNWVWTTDGSCEQWLLRPRIMTTSDCCHALDLCPMVRPRAVVRWTGQRSASMTDRWLAVSDDESIQRTYVPTPSPDNLSVRRACQFRSLMSRLATSTAARLRADSSNSRTSSLRHQWLKTTKKRGREQSWHPRRQDNGLVCWCTSSAAGDRYVALPPPLLLLLQAYGVSVPSCQQRPAINALSRAACCRRFSAVSPRSFRESRGCRIVGEALTCEMPAAEVVLAPWRRPNMEEVERERYKQAPVQQWQPLQQQQQQHGVHEFSGAQRPLEMRMSKVCAARFYCN